MTDDQWPEAPHPTDVTVAPFERGGPSSETRPAVVPPSHGSRSTYDREVAEELGTGWSMANV